MSWCARLARFWHHLHGGFAQTWTCPNDCPGSDIVLCSACLRKWP